MEHRLSTLCDYQQRDARENLTQANQVMRMMSNDQTVEERYMVLIGFSSSQLFIVPYFKMFAIIPDIQNVHSSTEAGGWS